MINAYSPYDTEKNFVLNCNLSKNLMTVWFTEKQYEPIRKLRRIHAPVNIISCFDKFAPCISTQMRLSVYVCMTACHTFQCQAVVWCNAGLFILIGTLRKQTVKFLSKYGGLHSSKCIWKYSPQNCVYFVSASMHLMTWWPTAHIFSYHWNRILIIMSGVADCHGADLRHHWCAPEAVLMMTCDVPSFGAFFT